MFTSQWFKTLPGTPRIRTPLTLSFPELCTPLSQPQHSLRTDLLGRLTIAIDIDQLMEEIHIQHQSDWGDLGNDKESVEESSDSVGMDHSSLCKFYLGNDSDYGYGEAWHVTESRYIFFQWWLLASLSTIGTSLKMIDWRDRYSTKTNVLSWLLSKEHM